MNPNPLPNVEEPTPAPNAAQLGSFLGSILGGFNPMRGYEPHKVGRSTKDKAKTRAQKQARKANRRKK